MLFTNYPKAIAGSYQRYLMNSLKEYFKQKKSIEKLQTINIKLYKDLKKTFKIFLGNIFLYKIF